MSLLRRFTLHPATSFIPFIRRLFPLLLLVLLFSLTLPGIAAEPVPLPHTSTSSSGDEQSHGVYYQQSQLKVVPDYGEVNSVALSADGNTALIHAYTFEDAFTQVFTRSGVNWEWQANLPAIDWIPLPLALSADGNTAMIGGQNSATVFIRSGTTWSQQATLTASDGNADDWFGRSLALSADGSTVLIGASNADVDGNVDQGAAYIFTRSGDLWTQQARLTVTDGAAEDYAGCAVALSADGMTALVDSPGHELSTSPGEGTASVFIHSGTTWTQQATLAPSTGLAEYDFACTRSAVALSAEGSIALIGNSRDDVDVNTDQGAAYVFTRSGDTWTRQAQLTASDGRAGNAFGLVVALSMDDTTAAISSASSDGSIYIFTRSGGTWTQQTKLNNSDSSPGDYFGTTLGLSGDGSLVLSHRHTRYMRQTGLVSSDASDDPDGSVYVFQKVPNLLTNGDFETDADSDHQPDGWTTTVFKGNKLKCNQPDKPAAFGGQCAYVFRGNSGMPSTLTQIIDGTGIEIEKNLFLMVAFRRTWAATSGTILFKVRFTNGEKSKGKIHIVGSYENPPRKRFDYYMRISTAVSVSSPIGSIKTIVRNPGTGGKLYVDNVGLIAVDASDVDTSNVSTVLPLPENLTRSAPQKTLPTH